MLAYGIPAEYYRTSESIAIEAMKHLTIAIRRCFESAFLRQQIQVDF
jgi:hypothetical protein